MQDTSFSHVSVLLNECIEGLCIRDGFTYVDGTTGGGGHSLEIAKRLPLNSRLICLDRDTDALAAARRRLQAYEDKITFVHTNFENIGEVLDEMHVTNLGGVLFDLGCSSYQLDTPERGFSYQHDAPLDMRMDTSAPLTAKEVVNTYSEDELRRILFEYGEERFSSRIARRIVERRTSSPIESTRELAELVREAIPPKNRIGGGHPAKRSFQAIRIEVNHELSSIAPAIRDAVARMQRGGRIAVISFHSLEDRITKQTLQALASGCTCPPDFPVCVCGKTPKIISVTKKPILPSKEELEMNNRSHSAKLRIAEKL